MSCRPGLSSRNSGPQVKKTERVEYIQSRLAELYPETPVRGEKGVFILRFVEKKVPDAPADAGELETIQSQLRQRKQRDVYGTWMAEARNQTEIEIDQSMLN